MNLLTHLQNGSDQWNGLQAPESNLYPWSDDSTYIKSPPFFETMVCTGVVSGDVFFIFILYNSKYYNILYRKTISFLIYLYSMSHYIIMIN